MLRKIFTDIKIVHVAPDDGAATTYALAAGTTTKTSVAVDALGWKTIAFLWTFGDNADTGTFTGKIQGSADGSTGWTDITGATKSITAGATDTDTGQIGVECGVDPAYRYYRVSSARGVANTVIADLKALLGRREGVAPITQLATAGQFFAAPVVV